MKPSTVSDTGSARRGSSLRLRLFVAIVCVAFICIVASALIAATIARQQVGDFYERVKRPPPWLEGRRARSDVLKYMGLGFLFSGLLGVLLALVLSMWIARLISKPVSRLTEATQSIARGEYGKRVEVSGSSEIASLAEAFNSLSENLERNEALRKNMVADIAHELRNPVATIRAQLEAIEDGVMAMDKDAIDSILEDTVMLSRLVEDLQQLSLVEAGQLELEFTPVEPGELVEGVGSRFERDLAEEKLAFRVELEEGLPPVRADQVRIAQVLGNLVKNSISYTPQGGSVELEASRLGEEVLFTVTDTGPGVARDEIDDVFERFFRTDRSRARATGGAGLGLSIARSLVEAHGGRIWAQSGAGEGMKVSFTIPVWPVGEDGCDERNIDRQGRGG